MFYKRRIRGEIATTLTLITIAILTVGIFVGTQLSGEDTDVRSRAAGCPFTGNPTFVSGSNHFAPTSQPVCQVGSSPSTTLVCAIIDDKGDTNELNDTIIAGQDPPGGPNTINWIFQNGIGSVPLFRYTSTSASNYKIVAYDWNDPTGCHRESSVSKGTVDGLFSGAGGTNPTTPPSNPTTPPSNPTRTPTPTATPATGTDNPTRTPTPTTGVPTKTPTPGKGTPTATPVKPTTKPTPTATKIPTKTPTPGKLTPTATPVKPTSKTTPTPTKAPSGQTPQLIKTSSCGTRLDYPENQYIMFSQDGFTHFMPYSTAAKQQESVKLECPGASLPQPGSSLFNL